MYLPMARCRLLGLLRAAGKRESESNLSGGNRSGRMQNSDIDVPYGLPCPGRLCTSVTTGVVTKLHIPTRNQTVAVSRLTTPWPSSVVVRERLSRMIDLDIPRFPRAPRRPSDACDPGVQHASTAF